MWQADEVLASRAELHGVDVAKQNPYQAAIDESARKSALRNKVYQLRDMVWKAPLEELRRRLGRLQIETEPGLAQLASRLSIIVEARAKLPQLTQRRDFDGDFFECFKQVLTGSSQQSAEMRERITASFQDRKLMKRGLRMIKLLRREVPELASIEADLFGRLSRQSRRGRLVVETGQGGSSNWWIALAIFLVLQLFYRLAKLLSEVE